ncbi:alpha/beta hydrolase [Kribbella sp. NPDC004875]|uniref:alpha/beta hydrolase n=1 Tax=Kribbella sp. NPDC004875 TaxID=3364107 RepID=UPI0036813EA9
MTEQQQNAIQPIDVSFVSAGLKLAGHLYTPRVDGPAPAVVVGHPGTGVKEQTAGLYARLLAEQGFVTLAFDAAYQGASEGEPRGLEDPGQRIEDLKAAVSFLTTRSEVDADRIGVLGICASGGYSLAAAGTDHRVKAVATVSAADIARQFRMGADGTQDPAVLQSMLDASAAARTAEARDGDGQSFDLFPATEDVARQGGQHVFEGWEYYCTPRGMHPRSAKTLTWSSIDRIVTFDAFRAVDLIAPRPLLLIAGSAAVTSWMSVEAFQRAVGTKELFWVDGATHVDLYDKPEYVTPAVSKLTDFFTTHLAAAQ